MNAVPNVLIQSEMTTTGPKSPVPPERLPSGGADGQSFKFKATLHRVRENKAPAACDAHTANAETLDLAIEAKTADLGDEVPDPAALNHPAIEMVRDALPPPTSGLVIDMVRDALPPPASGLEMDMALDTLPPTSSGRTVIRVAAPAPVAVASPPVSMPLAPADSMALDDPRPSQPASSAGHEAGANQTNGALARPASIAADTPPISVPPPVTTTDNKMALKVGEIVTIEGAIDGDDLQPPTGESPTDSAAVDKPAQRFGGDLPQAPMTARGAAAVTDQLRRSLKDSRTTTASVDAEKAQAETRKSVRGERAADTLGAGRNDAVAPTVRSPLIENPADSRMLRTSHHPAEPRAEGLTQADRNFNNVYAELNRPPASPGVAKELPPPAESFREQNVTQIAERIAVSIRGHQSEARIALKPDHLGHLRLQIATENHTVSIRIMTELPMARDLLESHLYQLKADLQQQGLDVEEFDVTLSEEQHPFRREERRPQGRPARPSQGGFGNPANRDASVDDETQNPRRGIHPSRTSGVDYFA